MADSGNLGIESPAVRAHIEIMQAVITRMAENSRSCKFWCVTLVAAVLVLVARTEKPDYIFIALIPAALFLFLDSYYLALEKAFRKSHETFVDKLHENELKVSEVYKLEWEGMNWRLVIRSFGSTSIWPFYLILTATIFVAWCWIL